MALTKTMTTSALTQFRRCLLDLMETLIRLRKLGAWRSFILEIRVTKQTFNITKTVKFLCGDYFKTGSCLGRHSISGWRQVVPPNSNDLMYIFQARE